MTERELWSLANRKLIARSIGELYFEGVLEPENTGTDFFVLKTKSGVSYSFQGWISVWDSLNVQLHSIRRLNSSSDELSAGQFFLDIQAETGMTDIILGQFLEEMHQTLYADLRVLRVQSETSVAMLAKLSGDEIQTQLSGHPKILLNKGRLGWSSRDIQDYAPESNRSFQLFWLGIDRNYGIFHSAPEFDSDRIINESFDTLERERLEQTLKQHDVSLESHRIIPVHPSQWERVIRTQYASEIAVLRMIPLGLLGDQYRPQISIRTLSNVSRPERTDIKLALSILNTSAVRGIAPKYIPLIPNLSLDLAAICAEDGFLQQSNTQILAECAGFSYAHPLYSQMSGAPYRYQESLGVVWRQSSVSRIAHDEKAVIAGAFAHRDFDGHCLAAEYARSAGVEIGDWLDCYFRVVILPLYHLQVRYGVGIVAHGQNIVVRLKNSLPVGVFLKDFQGDVRLLDQLPEASPSRMAAYQGILTQLPSHYLIHDLITGHFVTVLRFLSASLFESDGFSEQEFYARLRRTITHYLEEQGLESSNLFVAKIPRLLVNPVRFKIGYADSDVRPLPLLGAEIFNPLVPASESLL